MITLDAKPVFLIGISGRQIHSIHRVHWQDVFATHGFNHLLLCYATLCDFAPFENTFDYFPESQRNFILGLSTAHPHAYAYFLINRSSACAYASLCLCLD